MPFSGILVKNARLAMKPPLSQGKLARELSRELNKNLKKGEEERYVSPNTVSEWERGNTQPRGKMLDALVVITGKSYAFFFGEEVSNSLTKPRARKAA